MIKILTNNSNKEDKIMKKFDFQYKGEPYTFNKTFFKEEQENITDDNSTYDQEGVDEEIDEETAGDLQSNFEKLVNDLTEVLSKKDMKIVFDKIGDFMKSIVIETSSENEEEEEEPTPNEEDKKNESVADSNLGPETDNDTHSGSKPVNF